MRASRAASWSCRRLSRCPASWYRPQSAAAARGAPSRPADSASPDDMAAGLAGRRGPPATSAPGLGRGSRGGGPASRNFSRRAPPSAEIPSPPGAQRQAPPPADSVVPPSVSRQTPPPEGQLGPAHAEPQDPAPTESLTPPPAERPGPAPRGQFGPALAEPQDPAPMESLTRLPPKGQAPPHADSVVPPSPRGRPPPLRRAWPRLPPSRQAPPPRTRCSRLPPSRQALPRRQLGPAPEEIWGPPAGSAPARVLRPLHPRVLGLFQQPHRLVSRELSEKSGPDKKRGQRASISLLIEGKEVARDDPEC